MTSLADVVGGFVLALEGSTQVASCAIRSPDGLITELATAPGARQVESLPTLVGEVAASAGAVLTELGCIVVGSGPGSYMGIRATVSIANALSYAAQCQVAELSTLDSLGLGLARTDEDVLVALAAGRGRFFVAGYRELDGLVQRTREPELVEGAEVPGLDENLRPTARGHLKTIDRRPAWLHLLGIAGAQPRYGPSGREA